MLISRRHLAKLVVKLAALASAGGTATRAVAQIGAGRPIAMIVPFEAGSAPDIYARIVAEAMRQSLGRTLIVENKPGATGNIAMQAVAREPAEGNTILVGTMALCEINPLVFDNLRWSMQDFTPVIKGIGAPLVLVAHPDVPAKSLAELVAWVKANPAKLAYASYSAGAPGHFLGAQLNATFGLDLAHVPYRGSNSQVTEILAGHSPFGFAQTQSALAHIKSGALQPLAITSDERYRLLPDTPTFRELGYPEFSTSVWFGLLVRKGTPEGVLAALADAAVAAHANAHVREVLLLQGYEILGQTGEAFAGSIEAGSKRWEATVKATGFKASQ